MFKRLRVGERLAVFDGLPVDDGARRPAIVARPPRIPAPRAVFPHHPAAGRVIEQAVALPEIGMQAVLLDVLQQGPAGADLAEPCQGCNAFAVVPAAVGGDQDPGFGLPKTIRHAARAEVRRGGGKDRAQGGGQQGDHGLGHIGQPGRHAVAGRDARRLERGHLFEASGQLLVSCPVQMYDE